MQDALGRGLLHTHFVGLDLDESGMHSIRQHNNSSFSMLTGIPYAASVPTTIALSERGDVLLAYEMNGLQTNRLVWF